MPPTRTLRLAVFSLLLACLWAPAEASAQAALTIDLATLGAPEGVLGRVYGSVGEGRRGVPVAGGFDCDGDGHRDWAVAFFQAEPLGRELAGEVDLVFGDGTIGGEIDTAFDQAGVLRFYGAAARETAGSEIWMDDVTGDGLGDLLICRQNHTPPGRLGAGALTIVVGGSELAAQAETLQPVDLASPPAELTLTTILGAAELDRLCIWARTGDVDGDGTADLVVGADREDAPGETDRGAAYVVHGGAHLAAGGTIDLAAFGAGALDGRIAKLVPPPGSANFRTGATNYLADLDGNGRAEVLLAATLNRSGAGIVAQAGLSGIDIASGGAPDGRMYIAWDDNFPAPPWPAGLTIELADAAAPGRVTTLSGANNNINFGEELLGGLDFDADGRADLFVGDLTGDGSPGQDRPISGVGYVFYSAADLKGLELDLDTPPAGLRTTTILGPISGAIGADTAAQGDFDGDSVDDLAFGSPHADPLGRESAGAVHVLFGRLGGWPALIDTADGNLPAPTEVRVAEVLGANGTMGSDVGDTLCYSAAAGDLDRDGRTDLITNEMVGNGLAPGAVDVGNLIALAGAALVGDTLFVDGFDSGDFRDWAFTSFQAERMAAP